MIPLSIPEAGEVNAEGEVEVPSLDPMIETAMLALESANGIAVETDSKRNAMALRHRFYRAIQRERAKGNQSLISVMISLHKTDAGWELHLKPLPFKVRQL